MRIIYIAIAIAVWVLISLGTWKAIELTALLLGR